MRTVAAAIKEDLGRVKDALDIFVRQGGTQVDELAPQLDMLKKIGDTLGVLGLGELRDKVQSETTDLQAIVAQRSPASEGTLLRMAATLIKVEDSLDEQLVGMIVPTRRGGRAVRSPRARTTSSSARSPKRCCANASSTWRASRKRSRSRSRSRAKRRPSIRFRS